MSIHTSEATSRGENRSRDLILAAYHCLAVKGFEGLRLREIADQVGINHATLHHYFPTKETLVQAVVHYVMQRLERTVVSDEGEPREQLRAHLHSLQALMQEEPALFIVLNEIEQRALRDPAIRMTTQQQIEGWHSFLVRILTAGIACGSWPKDTDAQEVASAIIALMNSILVRLSPERMEQAIKQLERWLMM